MKEQWKNFEELEKSEEYKNSYRFEEKCKERGFNLEHTEKLYDHLAQFGLSMQLLQNHLFGNKGKYSEKLCETLIKISDPDRLQKIIFEVSYYNCFFHQNACPETNEIVINIINGAIYSPYVEMKYDIWDRYTGVEMLKSEFDPVGSPGYIASCKKFIDIIDQCAIEQKEPTLEILEGYNRLVEEGDRLKIRIFDLN